MAKKRPNLDKVFESIIGHGASVTTSEPITNAEEEPTPVTAAKEPVVEQTETSSPNEKLVKATFYITENQRKALKIQAALGNGSEDKNQSAIIRSLLDAYLADTVKTPL